MTKNTNVRMWLVFKSPSGAPVSYIARLFIARGDIMQPTSMEMNDKNLDVLRAIFTVMGCSLRPKKIGLVEEIWVEPETPVKMEIAG